MLYSRGNSLTLHSMDVAHRDARRQERVFAEIFKISAVHGSTIDVYSGAQKKMHAFGARIPANLSADLLRQSRLPGCRKRYSPSHGCGRPIITHSQRPVRHLKTGHAQSGNTAYIKIIDAA